MKSFFVASVMSLLLVCVTPALARQSTASSSAANSQEHARVIPGPSGVGQGTIVHMVKPVYPKAAIAKGIQGTVYFDAVIGPAGHVKKLKLLYGNAMLAKAAEPAIRKWVYKPTKVNGQVVQVEKTVNVRFELAKPKAKAKPAKPAKAQGTHE